MSILYSHDWYYEPADLVDDDQDDAPSLSGEALTITHGRVWWSASAELPDLD